MEVLIGIGVFSLFLTAVSLVVMKGQENSVMGGDRLRGLYATTRGLEAARSIRDASFSSLSTGAHGLALGAGGTWTFSGSQSSLTGSYVNTVTVSSLGTGWAQVLSQTNWKHGRFQSGSVLLRTELTDWRGTGRIGDWSSASQEGRYAPGGGTPFFTGMAIAGNYAYLTSDITGGGAGLYIVDISNTASPSGSSFALGAAAYGAAAKGTTLYLATGSSSQEIKAYDITSPSSPTLLTSYNLSGSNLAASLSLAGPRLYVGATQDATYNEFYSFDVSHSGSILPLGSLEVGATVNAVSLSGTGAFLALNDGSGEMRVVNVANPSSLAFAANGTYNLTGTEAGTSIFLTGTSALLGRQKGNAIQEMVLMNTALGGGSPPPAGGVWYHEGSGSLIGVGTDPYVCYGFLSADSHKKAFQIVDLHALASLPELFSFDSSDGPGRAILYDPVRDRVFVLTRSALLIFRPSSSTGSCG